MSSKQRYCICRSTDSKSFMIGCDKCEEWFHGKCIDISPKKASCIKRYYCVACQQEDPSLRIKYKKRKDKHEKDKDEPQAKKVKPSASSSKPTAKPTAKPTSPTQCGECSRCQCFEDCESCDFCKDMKKFGGPNKFQQKCRRRQCKTLGIRPDDEKYLNVEDDSQTPHPKPEEDLSNNTPKPKKAVALKPPKQVKPPKPPKPPKPEKKKRGPKPGSKQTKPRKPYTKRKQNENKSVKPQTSAVSRQCYGPRCLEATRPGSKYCSDDCGMKLCAMRLVEIMPRRIKQWQSSPCVAEQKNRKGLDEIRDKILQAKKHLESLDEKHRAIDRIVERGKKEKVKQEESDEEENSDDEEEGEDMELFVYCVTCGHEVRQRNAFKHMEKCFVKIEKDMSFAGSFKSMIGGDTICDHYNVVTKSYCKRLKVICAEHAKDAKVADDEICGCPLTRDVFAESGELCKTAKKSCTEHFRWERMRRAEIDADKVRQWMKIDELFERERLIRTAMTNRAGLMSLLLHQTVDHEALQVHHKMHTPAKPVIPSTVANRDLSQAISTEPPRSTDEGKEAADEVNIPLSVSSMSPPHPAVSNPQPTSNTAEKVSTKKTTPRIVAPPTSAQSSTARMSASAYLLNIVKQSAETVKGQASSAHQLLTTAHQRNLVNAPYRPTGTPSTSIQVTVQPGVLPAAVTNKTPLIKNILKTQGIMVMGSKGAGPSPGVPRMVIAAGGTVVQTVPGQKNITKVITAQPPGSRLSTPQISKIVTAHQPPQVGKILIPHTQSRALSAQLQSRVIAVPSPTRTITTQPQIRTITMQPQLRAVTTQPQSRTIITQPQPRLIAAQPQTQGGSKVAITNNKTPITVVTVRQANPPIKKPITISSMVVSEASHGGQSKPRITLISPAGQNTSESNLSASTPVGEHTYSVSQQSTVTSRTSESADSSRSDQ